MSLAKCGKTMRVKEKGAKKDGNRSGIVGFGYVYNSNV
jgi:hypothetical protein